MLLLVGILPLEATTIQSWKKERKKEWKEERK